MLTTDFSLPAKALEAIRIPTVSLSESQELLVEAKDPSSASLLHEFTRLHAYLRQEFPNVHAHFNVSVINGGSLIMEPPARPKFLFYAHMDVVPGTGVDPFAGRFNQTSGTLHGRGGLDMKGHFISFLTVTESLLTACEMESDSAACFDKVNSWTIALGHDEEPGGEFGAKKIAEYLAAKGSVFEASFDEGLPAVQNLLPLPGNPVLALVGVTERGFMNVKISLSSEGGHSSMSKWADNPSNLLGTTLNLLETKFAFKTHPASKPVVDTFKLLVLPSWARGNVVADAAYDFLGMPYLVGKLAYEAAPMTHPFLRTTTAVTQFFSGNPAVDNVVPSSAVALINVRIHPSERVQDIEHHYQAAMKEIGSSFPQTVSWTIEFSERLNEPSPVSPYEGDLSTQYNRLKGVLEATHSHHSPGSEVLVGPGIMPGGTDTKHFLNAGVVRGGVAFRVSPFVLRSKKEMGGIHGVDEFVSVDNVAREVEFYYRLIMD
ncbi:hypothetical protein HDU98_010470 [Podochytrium sp. JEL0797]|nr:hypothetical protein HDU98_010470 [Podochytrium sp. JEL0797]